MTLRVLHVAVAYASHEGMARAATELARRVDGVHGLVTNHLRTEADAFSWVRSVGGSMTFFHLTRARQIRAALEAFDPDIVHLHGGVMTPLFANAGPYRRPVIASVYGWASPPGLHELRGATRQEVRQSAVAQSRVFVTGALPDAAVRWGLRRTGRVRGVLTPDERLAQRLRPLAEVPVLVSEVGAEMDSRRARFATEPVIVFAGRAETARGVDTLIDAMPAVLDRHPKARLRLLLLPAPQLPILRARAAASSAAAAIEFVTTPIEDLRSELSRATVAAFPFKYDHTTAMAPPLTVVEAMSVGLPVVVSAVACMAPVVDARQGALVVAPRDPGALAASLTAALRQPRWSQLSDEASALVGRRWNWDRAADVASGLYREVASAP